MRAEVDGEWVDAVYSSLKGRIGKPSALDLSFLDKRPTIEDVIDLFRLADISERLNKPPIIWLPRREYLNELTIKLSGRFSEKLEDSLSRLSESYKQLILTYIPSAKVLDTLSIDIAGLSERTGAKEYVERNGRGYYGYDLNGCEEELRRVYQDNYACLLGEYLFEPPSLVIESPAEIPAIEDASKLGQIAYASTLSATDLTNKGTWRMYDGRRKGKLVLMDNGYNEEVLSSLTPKPPKKDTLLPILFRFSLYPQFGVSNEEFLEVLDMWRRSPSEGYARGKQIILESIERIRGELFEGTNQRG